MKTQKFILVNAQGSIRHDVSLDDLKAIYELPYDIKREVFAFALPQSGLNPKQRARDIVSIFRQVANIESRDPERGDEDFLCVLEEYMKDDMRGLTLAGYRDSLDFDREDYFAEIYRDEISRLHSEYCRKAGDIVSLWTMRFEKETGRPAPSETALHLTCKGIVEEENN